MIRRDPSAILAGWPQDDACLTCGAPHEYFLATVASYAPAHVIFNSSISCAWPSHLIRGSTMSRLMRD